ncbi:GL14204 [Drosophila persimilis]|uniref:GL14204 n=1 Tax=Drosophila persimilis TaxID=7234 RepID=B4GTV1_DROPE|nr:GL14204 [Drosophila persimilis]
MLRLMSHCPVYSIFCCRQREAREEDQQTIADQLEIPQEQPQLHGSPAESSTAAIIMPMQEVPRQEFHSPPKRVAWTTDRMFKRHTRRRASHSPAQLEEMCVNVEVHHFPKSEAETETAPGTQIPHLALQLGREMALEPDSFTDNPIAAGVEVFPSDTVAILHLATIETATATLKHHQPLM